MLGLLREKYKDKKILVLGFGREGKSTLGVLKRAGLQDITVADMADVSEAVAKEGCNCVWGEDYQNCLDDYDVVFKSPGIVLKKPYNEYKCHITAQVTEFVQAYREHIIGITGTKGKSTTVTLLYHILKNSGKKVVLGGNIGIPVFELIDEMMDDKETLAVVELSCHQLEYIDVSPKWAVLINLYEEHLDHYGTFEKYIEAKKHIYTYQKNGDKLFVKADIAPKAEEFALCESEKNCIEEPFCDEKAALPTVLCITPEMVKNMTAPEGTKLLGEHNLFNMALIKEIIKEFDINDKEFREGLVTYEPLPHRLQFIGEVDGVKYYDDSISTIGETTIQAVKSVKNVSTILVGGMDRGIVYDDFEEFLSNRPVKNIILMYETGRRIYEEMKQKNLATEGIIVVSDLKEAVKTAKKVTLPGEACVMSPAAASYGYFKNFEERGDVFKKLVLDEHAGLMKN